MGTFPCSICLFPGSSPYLERTEVVTVPPGSHLCPEMQAVTKMANLTKFRQTDVGQSDDFYANYITRDGVNMLANLTNLAIFMQITS